MFTEIYFQSTYYRPHYSSSPGMPDDPYPIPTRTHHFCQPVPYTNPYPIPTRTIYLTHVMRGSAAASGQAARARAAGGLLATQAVVRPSRGKVRAGRRTQSP